MKKYIQLTLAILIFLFAAVSCKKNFLTEKVYSNFTPQTLTDSLAFEAAVAGIQSQYDIWHTIANDNLNSQGWLCVWQIGTDVAFNKSPADFDPMSIPYTNYTLLNSSDPAALFAWKWSYVLINNCNVVIANIENPKLVMGLKNKNSIDAEAKFFRGLAYNTLATLFGRVPIITVPVVAAKTDFVRAPLTDVNKLILSDLVFAKANLPNIEGVKLNGKGKMYGRANTAMASQLLSEVYLRTGDNASAQAEADAVINSGFFSLTASRYGVKAALPGDAYSDMFQYGNQRRSQGNKEAIWVYEIENPKAVIGGTGLTSSSLFPGFAFGVPQYRRVWGSRYHQQAGMLLCDSLGGRGISRIALTYFVLNGIYGAGDMRNSPYNLRRNYYYNNPASAKYGQLVKPGAGVDTNRLIVPKTNKWDAYDPNDVFGFATIKDVIVMRLGETYLLKAEAQFKQGDLGGAASTINIIRARANATLIGPADITLDFILDERARELVAEENRRMTLMRTGTLLSRVKTRGVNITGISATNILLPIPLSEIQLNKDAVLEQNPGY